MFVSNDLFAQKGINFGHHVKSYVYACSNVNVPNIVILSITIRQPGRFRTSKITDPVGKCVKILLENITMSTEDILNVCSEGYHVCFSAIIIIAQ